ncbi:bifunctional 3-(3-hydroxy-phenyl)propionate/3-hydroxycinnamic acid hydroxylase [Aminobacter aminovorans]|jgi:3-(3-hydroxy-phenyl)propionate hydroxylase|uniref:2-polyprenyl-6-methoxyphenol hydroxylase-like oxidoreductase n=1 Tax=Aminobacter aminovorans TaxID=83263 RepID=A0AAC9ATA4_AMIAI|nr:bifunctional 3-(3-hydroxy-phenyl)propionate/3-hydroxycinnamic acid hydroxylase [Aminobacter aminovorans]AMS45000.1 2-polyprenyl-6-methoxyphenol hydroxylase-like oxidoreductase [Aminobacter aminovorans]MBB3710089.1 3-(3-hydroxy-phenyl)propionate hydroxylase [Aminobacter aminovorans]
MADYQCDIAVLGAGPTGLTIANLLGQAGVRVVLIERNASTVTEPRAVSIDDESLRSMQATGLVGEVLKDVAQDYGSYYYSARGTRFLAVAPSSRDYGFPKRNAFSQPLLEATLRRGLERYSNVETLFSHSCEEIDERADGVVLSLKDADGRDAAVQAAYMVGSDGARSMARRHVGATFDGSTYKQRWLIVDLASTRERLRQTRIMCDPARPFITLPGPRGIRRYEFLLHDHENDGSMTSDEAIHGLLSAHGPDADQPVVRRQIYTFHARIADRWNTDRVYLAGDAAHLSPPFAGQGMNSGVRDAHNIAWKLASVVKGEIGPGLLKSYQAERRPHAAALIKLAVRSGGVMVPSSRLNAWLVQTAFRVSSLIPSVQAYFAQMKYKPRPHYTKGFVSTDDGELSIAGRMVLQPLVETADGRHVLLDDLVGPGFRLVAFGDAAQRLLDEARRHCLGFHVGRPLAILPSTTLPDREAAADIEVVRELDGLMGKTMPQGRTVLMLIRPDRYVAAATAGLPEEFADRIRQMVAACNGGDAAT